MEYKNGEIVRIGDIKYPPWDWGVRKGGKLNEKAMNQNLLDFKQAMDKYNIPFVFIFGSCLGLTRKFHRPWAHPEDTDVDIMCYAIDHRKMLPVIEELENNGFFIPDRNQCPMRDHFITRNGEKIEIWWFESILDDMYYSERVWYSNYFFNTLTEIEYLGKKWKLPTNPERFCEITYGRDWQVPNPSGSYILKEKHEI